MSVAGTKAAIPEMLESSITKMTHFSQKQVETGLNIPDQLSNSALARVTQI